MSILTNIVAAEEDELEDVGLSARPVDEWSGVEWRGIDTAKIATLHCLLTGDEFELALGYYEPVFMAEEGATVLRMADEVLESLAVLEEESLEAVAAELAATEEYEQDLWDVEQAQEFVMSLAELARLAESQGQVLFVWIHPLLT